MEPVTIEYSKHAPKYTLNKPTRLLRKPEVLHLTGLATSTLYSYMSAGRFPRPVKVGARSVAWPEEAVLDWIASRPVADIRTEEAAG